VAFDEAQNDYEELSTKRDELKEQFSEITTKKNEVEETFFNAIENLRGKESNELLIQFIQTSQNQIEVKAEYNALTKLKGMYETAVSNMDARIKDIEANRRALIEGVKVVDIKGSDIDLIIEEGAL
jgi:chromosome segregation ATPase